jgi:predicted DNA-binding transcriptional regulator YafY
MMLEKYLEQTIEIIYEDRKGNITQRKIQIHSIRDQRIRATCLETGKPRVFNEHNILSWRPEKGRGTHAS